MGVPPTHFDALLRSKWYAVYVTCDKNRPHPTSAEWMRTCATHSLKSAVETPAAGSDLLVTVGRGKSPVWPNEHRAQHDI